ncbi:MAG TPA: IS21 family transposase [Nitrospirae bacterium]|nr:IS21 family transposase [Nitrospirota bacterium]
MAKKKKRTAMRKIREILRLHFDSKLSNRQIADALQMSKTNVYNSLSRFKESELTWPIPEDMPDTELQEGIYSEKPLKGKEDILPDVQYIQEELTRPHMTLELLWKEYAQDNPEGLSRSSFYRHYQKYRKGLSISMKVIHKGGKKVFVDYSGDGLRYFNREEGKWEETGFFVGSWGASSHTYAECTASQSGQDWVKSHIRAVEYFGCVPKAFVPDNLKSAVTKANFYEPEINALYGKFAQHYDTVILPARVRKPRDKPVVESNILHLQRFIFGRLRNHTFFSLAELNQAVWEALELYNDRPMQQYKKSRKERFKLIDKPYALPLPTSPFQFTQVKYDVRAAPNYHIEFDKHYYSVPHEIARECVDVYQINNILEIYHDGNHVCRHKKEPPNYRYTARNNRRLSRMIGRANFKPEQACIENIHYDLSRGFAKTDMMQFKSKTWIENSHHVIITGPTGTGKTYIAEAIGLYACKMGYPVRKIRYKRLFEEIQAAKGTGGYLNYLRKLQKIKVL